MKTRIAKRLLPKEEAAFERRIILGPRGQVLKKIGVCLSRCFLDRQMIKDLLKSGVIIDITPDYDVEIDGDLDVAVITY
ncbi:hypothetical protein [Desulfurobacterium sp.]